MHTGHGLGLGHPEPSYLVPESIDTLQAHDVLALEPGLYLPEVAGMRFERNYLITVGGHETLTRHQLGLTQARSYRVKSLRRRLDSDHAPAAVFSALRAGS